MENQNQNTGNTIASLEAQLKALKLQDKENALIVKNAKKEVTNLFNSEFKSFSKLFRFISKNKELISKGYLVSVELLNIENVCNAVDALRLAKKQTAIDNINVRIVLLKAQNSLLIEAAQPNAIEVKKLKALNKSLVSVETKALNEFYVPFSINTIIKGLK